jgi:protein phosphatase
MHPAAIPLPSYLGRATERALPPRGQAAGGAPAVEAFGMTDKGQVRLRNEDQFLIATLTKALQIQQTSLPQAKTKYSDERGHLFVVADGMGGHQAGQQASALAVDAIEKFVLNTLQWFLHLRGAEGQTLLSEFHTALQQTDACIYHEARRHPHLWGMGTTLTMAYCLGRDLFLAHVGDSRCYLFRKRKLNQLTHDHTLVQELVRQGQVKPEEVSQHRLRHVITNVLGSAEPGVLPEVHKVRLEAGDLLVLCSDGLTEMVTNDEISLTLREETELQRICASLVAQANGRGGKDNITVILARFDFLADPHGPA